MKNKFVLFAVCLLIAGIVAAVLYSREVRKKIDAASAKIESEETGSNDSFGAGIGGMTITDMEIVQGEKGQEEWRLVSIDAVMQEQGGDIIAKQPYLTYYLKSSGAAVPAGSEERDFLTVKSKFGDLNQQEKRMRFVDDVVVTHGADVLTTSILTYDGNTNRLNFPEESLIDSIGMDGKAAKMFWNLEDNTLHASGGVNIDLETQRSFTPGGVK